MPRFGRLAEEMRRKAGAEMKRWIPRFGVDGFGKRLGCIGRSPGANGFPADASRRIRAGAGDTLSRAGRRNRQQGNEDDDGAEHRKYCNRGTKATKIS